jgi:hypothetical protein
MPSLLVHKFIGLVFGYHKMDKGYYRSGAVEQLRYMNLNVLGHSSNVELYKSGYGKDDAISALFILK